MDQNWGNGWRFKWDILANDIQVFADRTFDKGSEDYQALHDALHPVMVSVGGDEKRGFLDDYGEPVARALALVKHRLEQGHADLLQKKPDEILIEPGTPHSAYVFLRDVVQAASRLVFLVDPYVDRSIFSLLSNVPTGVEIRVLTRQQNAPADFAAEALKFTQQFGSNLECRAGLNDFHDRFLVVDEKLFLSGASFKDLGKKVSVVAEVQDIKAHTLAELEARWNSAGPLK